MMPEIIVHSLYLVGFWKIRDFNMKIKAEFNPKFLYVCNYNHSCFITKQKQYNKSI